MSETYTLRRKDGEELTLSVRECRPDELDAIMAMQDRVMEKISDPELYIYSPREHIEESLQEDYNLGAYLPGGTIVAYTNLIRPRISDRNLAWHLGYPHERAIACATADSTWVEPEYRGFGIQYELSRRKDEAARAMGAAEILACTSPRNIASHTSLRKNGYEIIDRKVVYGGYPRLILRKEVL